MASHMDRSGGTAHARAADECGLEPVIGNMIGTSLGMAPSFPAEQLCWVISLDDPVFLMNDRAIRITYKDD